MLTSSLLMCVLLAVAVAQRVVEENLPECDFGPRMLSKEEKEDEEERSRRICPENAVCADVWNAVRDWQNGTKCRERRITFNCRCPSNEGHSRRCPVSNSAFVLYANEKLSQYMCQPACNMQACHSDYRPAKEMVAPLNIRRGRGRGRRPMGNRRNRSYRYYRINCRCADHHEPLPSGGVHGLNRATIYRSIFFDRPNNQILTQFKCARYLSEENDPCL